MYYAVKTIDGKEVNLIFNNWPECKAIVWQKKDTLYKSFPTEDAAKNFLNTSAGLVTETAKNIPDNVLAEKLYVRFKDKIFRADDGYSVYLYEQNKKKKITCVGYDLPDNKKMEYILYGKFEKTKKYGYQFHVERYEEYLDDSKNSIISYLTSGLIKGIGPKKAEAIYNMFGQRTIEIIENEPKQLLRVPGIKKKNFEKMMASYEDNKGARLVTQYLIPFGISYASSIALYRKYRLKTIETIKENPYLLCYERGIDFNDADRVSKSEGIAVDSKMRFNACALYILHMNERTGNTGMEINDFGQKVWMTLNGYMDCCHSDEKSSIKKETVNEMTIQMIREKKLRYLSIEEKKVIFSLHAYQREENIKNEIIRLMGQGKCANIKEAEEAVKRAEEATGIELDVIQETAVIHSLTKGIMSITGGPGSGKTTVLRVLNLAYSYLYPKNERIFLAPTGRAARKIAESTGENTYTIHSYLHIYKDTVPIEDAITIKNSLIVIDEFSMTDANVAEILFSSILNGCNVVFVGDIHQLESVGPGAIMRDIYENGFVPTIELTHIYRQNKDAQIYKNVKKIKEGNIDILDGEDFEFHECSTMEDVKNEMAQLYVSFVKEYGLLNVMCLCPYLDNIAGVNDMNVTLQELINPASIEKNEIKCFGKLFREGDLVMHTGGNTLMTSNGDIGVITQIEIDDEIPTIYVEINNKIVEYEAEEISSLTLAYAMSIHKSQGSEADAVVTCLTNEHKTMLYRNIPYVSISRGKKKVAMFGHRQALNTAIINKKKGRRITLLGYLLKKESGEFVSVA